MDCEGAITRVYEYLDGELTVWRRRAITRHLDRCPPCAQGFTFEVEVRRVAYVRTHPPDYPVKYVGEWPDPLPRESRIDVPPGRIQPVWITVHAPDGTPPGDYAGAVTLDIPR